MRLVRGSARRGAGVSARPWINRAIFGCQGRRLDVVAGQQDDELTCGSSLAGSRLAALMSLSSRDPNPGFDHDPADRGCHGPTALPGQAPASESLNFRHRLLEAGGSLAGFPSPSCSAGPPHGYLTQ